MPGHPLRARWPTAARRYLVIVGLSGFAISQPLLSILGDDPTTLAHHDIGGRELIVLASLISLVPPLLLCAAQAAAAWVDERAGRAVHLVTVVGLIALFTIQLAKSAGIDQRTVLIGLAAIAGIGFAIAHIRLELVAAWASYTAILPVLAAAAFVLVSPASALLQSVDDGPARVEGAGASDAPVVLILLDELPTRSLIDDTGSIDPVRFPGFAAFADDATWYRHNSSMATFTGPAVPSLLSGNLPRTDPPLWTNYPNSLFSLLAPTHELEVFESVTSMCPYTSCVPTRTTSDGRQEAIDDGSPGFADLLDLTVEVWKDRITPGPDAPSALDDFAEQSSSAPDPAPQSAPVAPEEGEAFGGYSEDDMRSTAVRAERLIESFDADKGTTFYFLHLMLPHQPFVREPDGELYSVTDPVGFGIAEDDRVIPFSWSDWEGAVSEQRHLLQAQYTDRLIGRMMEQLRAEGMYDDALVIVTADHGISFESRTEARKATDSTVDALSYVPLLIKPPGQQEGAVDDSNLMTIDLVPTVADILDLPIGWQVDGSAAGSAAISERGDAKRMYTYQGFAQLTLEDVVEYDDAEVFPTVADGWIGPLTDPNDPLSGLHALLDLDGLIGEDLEAVRTGTDGRTLRVERLDLIEEPGEGPPPVGLVTGRVEGAPTGGRLVLALDGVIVGGSRFSTDADGRDGRVAVLLPQSTIGDDHDVRAALLVDGRVLELEVESG